MKWLLWLVGGSFGLLILSVWLQSSPVWADSNPAVSCPDDPLLRPGVTDPLLCFSDAVDDAALGQVRSVEEFSDVHPTDWAYQALRSLIERYGILTGYDDRTFRGNRSLTRYEFAAALDAVMTRFDQLYGTVRTTQLREDFVTLQRLQQAYGNILGQIRDRVTQLEPFTSRLEQQQFSTTTKLSTQTVIALTNGSNADSTLLTRVRLNLNTSFTGNDLLRTQLEMGNNGGDAISRRQNTRGPNLLGTNGILADGGGLDFVEVPNNVRVSKLYYTFQPSQNLSLTVGARLNPRDFIDYNRFANDSLTNFASSFFMNNPLIVQNQIDRPGGAGAAVTWQLGDTSPFTLRALYVAANAENPSGAEFGGLFGDRKQGSFELEYAFNRNLVARLQYTNALVDRTSINAGGMNVEWAFNRQFAFFGRLGIGNYKGFNSRLNQNLALDPLSWAVGGTVRDIVIPGSVAGLAIGQPFVEKDLGSATQTNVEAYYTFQLNENISFSPSFLILANANNRPTGTIFEWVLRMTYQF